MLKFYKSVKISTKKANVAKIRFCIDESTDESLSYDFELDVRSECYEKKKDIIILKGNYFVCHDNFCSKLFY